jgi:hypothetical protein
MSSVLNLSARSSKFCTIAIFIIVDLKPIFYIIANSQSYISVKFSLLWPVTSL